MRAVKIDHLVHVYNAHDADAFARCFTADAEIYEYPAKLAQKGRDAIHAYYEQLFDQYPLNKSDVLHRADLGDRIVDHERVHRSPSARPFDVIAVYTFNGDLVSRLDFIREHRE
jgi:uncharacterized protein (TIGR02246 family)